MEELDYAQECDSDGDFILGPTTGLKMESERRIQAPYTSDTARELSKAELKELLDDQDN